MANAICMHETSCGEKGVGKTKNNLCGIRRHSKFESYKTKQDGFNDCLSVYVRLYKGKSIAQMSLRWTTTQQTEWRNNVMYYYFKFLNGELELKFK